MNKYDNYTLRAESNKWKYLNIDKEFYDDHQSIYSNEIPYCAIETNKITPLANDVKINSNQLHTSPKTMNFHQIPRKKSSEFIMNSKPCGLPNQYSNANKFSYQSCISLDRKVNSMSFETNQNHGPENEHNSNGQFIVKDNNCAEIYKINPYKSINVAHKSKNMSSESPNFKNKFHSIMNISYSGFDFKPNTKFIFNEDKEVDTSDLEFFVRNNRRKETSDEFNKRHRKSSKDSSNCSWKNATTKTKSELGLSVLKNNNQSESQSSTSLKASDIRSMLNNLLNTLENNKLDCQVTSESLSNKSYGTNNTSSSIVDKTEINKKLTNDCERPYNIYKTHEDNCFEETSVKRYSTKKKKKKNASKFNCGSLNSYTSTQSLMSANLKNPILYSKSKIKCDDTESLSTHTKMYIRGFTVDPFDDIIKSHLSITDRRLKAISKKIDCTIKISGPKSNVSNNYGCNRGKVLYHVYLISNVKDIVNKCLKCLQDSFPTMRLTEIPNPTFNIL